MDNKKNEEDLVILFEMNINSDRSYVGTAERNFFLIIFMRIRGLYLMTARSETWKRNCMDLSKRKYTILKHQISSLTKLIAIIETDNIFIVS